MRFITNFTTTLEEAERLLEERRDVAIDIETVSLECLIPLGIGLAIDDKRGYYFFNANDVLLAKAIDNANKVVFHNAKFDLPILVKLGFNILGYEDTKTLAYSNGFMDTSLEELSKSFLLRDYTSVSSQWKKKDSGNIGIDHVKMGGMCITHACNTYALYNELEQIPLYTELDKPYVDCIMEMESSGLLIDQYQLTLVEQSTIEEVCKLEQELHEILGGINLASNPQVAKAFTTRGILGTRKTKAGKDSVSDESLAPLNNPIANKLLKWRSLMKTITTYVPAFRNIDIYGRIHTSFGYTETGRLLSRRPNLQNITNNDLRKTIVTPRGYSFLSLDANQLELRVVAALSQDPALLEDVNTGDVHLATAIRMFGFTEDKEEMERRRYQGKQCNFATLYGADEFKLSEMLKCSMIEAQQFKQMYFGKYKVLDAWIKEQRKLAKEVGYVVSMFGRKRPLPDLTAASWKLREKGEREVANTIVQGTAADIVKKMQMYLKETVDKSVRFVLQVHDEILMEVPDEILDKTKELVSNEVRGAFPYYPVTIKYGKNYGTLEKE